MCFVQQALENDPDDEDVIMFAAGSLLSGKSFY